MEQHYINRTRRGLATASPPGAGGTCSGFRLLGSLQGRLNEAQRGECNPDRFHHETHLGMSFLPLHGIDPWIT